VAIAKIVRISPRPPYKAGHGQQSVNKVHVSVLPRDDENVDQYYPNSAQTIVQPATLTAHHKKNGEDLPSGGAVSDRHAHNVSLLSGGKYYRLPQNTDTTRSQLPQRSHYIAGGGL
jgi:hypothetical protein